MASNDWAAPWLQRRQVSHRCIGALQSALLALIGILAQQKLTGCTSFVPDPLRFLLEETRRFHSLNFVWLCMSRASRFTWMPKSLTLITKSISIQHSTRHDASFLEYVACAKCGIVQIGACRHEALLNNTSVVY